MAKLDQHSMKSPQSVFSSTLMPLVLIVLVPPLTLILNFYQIQNRNASAIFQRGVLAYATEAFEAIEFFDVQTWLIILIGTIWSTVVPFCVGGTKFFGPPSLNGYRPAYVDAGFRYYSVTTVIFTLLLYSPIFPSAWTCYKLLLPLSGALCIFGFAVCILLMIKGCFWPSPGPHDSSGNPVFDFYWGLEVYPRIGKYFDFKLWAISRFGMMAWVLIVLVTWKAQYEIHGFDWGMFSSSLSQLIYLGKFSLWEYGYMHTLDITEDRAGYYLVWGCIGFLPFFLTSTSIFLVENPTDISPSLSIAYLVLGVFLTFLTYWIDCERLRIRDANGKCNVWGKPAKYIVAQYTDHRGREKKNLLVCSGFWGVVRHPNYIIELLANFAWMFPCGFTNIVPYLWGIFLFVLIIHRNERDEKKCALKYGQYWTQYKNKVKYRLIPGLF